MFYSPAKSVNKIAIFANVSWMKWIGSWANYGFLQIAIWFSQLHNCQCFVILYVKTHRYYFLVVSWIFWLLSATHIQNLFWFPFVTSVFHCLEHIIILQKKFCQINQKLTHIKFTFYFKTVEPTKKVIPFLNFLNDSG